MRLPRLSRLIPLVIVCAGFGGCGGDSLVLPKDAVPAAIAIVSGDHQAATVGALLPESLVVRVTDASGKPVEGQPVAFTVTAGGGSVAPASSQTNAAGVAGARWTLGSGAGTQTVQAKVTGNGAPANLVANFSATAGSATATTIAMVRGDAQTGTAGSSLADSLVVLVTDASANPVAGVAVDWAVTGGGSVSAPTTTTGADGRTGVQRTLGTVAGPQTTQASAAGLTGSPVTFNSTATVGSAGRLLVATQPSSTASSGAALAQPPDIQLADGGGNPVTTAGIAVSVSLATTPGPGASLVGATTVPTNAQGRAVFTGLGISGPAGAYTLNFSGTNLTGVTSATVTLTAGAAAKLVFTAQPSNAAAGATITPPVTVTVQDALGNTVTGATSAVTVALANNPGGATLGGTKTVNAVAGVATFAGLSVNMAGNGYTLGAASAGLTGATSNAFNIATGAAAAIAVNGGNGQSATAGSAVATPPSVKVTDGSGNGVAGVSVTFTVTGGGGSVSGASQSTNAQGIATVGSWTLGTTAGTNTLSAASAGLAGSPVVFTATGTTGSAGKLAILVQPSATAQSGVPLAQQPQLQLQDVNGNPVNTAGQSVTASVASGPSGSTLSNATATTNGSGVATFAGLAITGPSGAYTLSFGGASLTGVTSTTVTVGSGAATKLALTTQPSTTVPNNTALAQQPVIQLEDASGNPVGQAGVTVTAVPQGGASLIGSTSAVTNSAGIATFTNLGLRGTVGSYTLLFSAPSLTSTQSAAPIDITPGAVSAANSTLSATSPIVAGTGSSTVTVTALDISSNPIPGATVVPTDAPAVGVFSPSSGTTNGSGVATFGYSSNASGGRTIGASIASTTIAQTAAVTVQPGPASPAVSTISISPSNIPADGATAATITVTAKDAQGNPVSGVTVGFAVTGSNTVTPATATSASNGVATATVTSTSAGLKTVTGTVNSQSITSNSPVLTVTVLGPSAATSSVSVTPSTTTAGTAVTVDVVAQDVNGNALSGATIALSSDAAGTFGNPSPTTNASGQASTTFTPTAAAAHTITAQITAGSSIQKTTTLTVAAGAVDPAQSALTVGPPASFTAGGTGTTVTVTALDQYGNPIAGAAVAISLTGTNSVSAAGATDAAGQATSTVTSTEAGVKTATAKVNGVDLNATGTVTVNPDVPDAGTSSVTASPASVAPGAPSTVTVTVRDQFNNAVPGIVPTFAETANPGPGTGTFTAAAATDAAGVTTSDFSSTDPGQDFTITVTAGGITITQTAVVSTQ